MTAKEKAWQAYCESIMPTRRDYVYPLQGAFYKAFCAGYDAAQRKEWVGLTHEERDAVCADFVGPDDRVGAYRSLALEVEVLLTEKNRRENDNTTRSSSAGTRCAHKNTPRKYELGNWGRVDECCADFERGTGAA